MKSLFVTKPFFIEPLGLMSLSAAAKERGHDIQLAWTGDELEQRVTEFNPDVVAYSAITGGHDFFLNLNQQLKQGRNFTSIFGGPHPTFFPEIINQPGVDAICVGEGDQAFPDFLDALESGSDPYSIQNLWFNKAGKIIKNPVRPLADLDELPVPDRDLLPQQIRDGPISHHIAGRGCPFSCSYCFNEKYSNIYDGKGKRVRLRDPSALVSEIEKVVADDPVRFVYFQDDTFTLNRKWLAEFAKEYAAKVDKPYHCHVRPNTVNEETTRLLAESGCYSAHIAAEAGNDRLRNEVLNRGMSKEQIITSCRMLKDKGIGVMLQNIIGLPTGSLEDDMETLDLNIECQPDYAWVSIFQPYPGTPLGEQCKRDGLYTGNFSDLGSSFFESSPLNVSDQYKRQLANFQKLFAIAVENPELHRNGLLRTMIDLERTPEIKEAYAKAYKSFRDKGDRRLYGFDL